MPGHHFGSDDDDDHDGGAYVSGPAKLKPKPAAAHAAEPRSPQHAVPPPGSHWQAPAGCHVGLELTPQQVHAAISTKRTKLLGSGGFGKVYAADLPPLGHVAIKLATPGGEKALAAEAIHLRRCAHPAIVRALASCWVPGSSALVLEHVSGGCLDDRLGLSNAEDGGSSSSSGGKGHAHLQVLSWRTRIRVTYQIASALAYLHNSLAVVHCDVKPGNLLLDAASNNATLIDFGIARPVVGDIHAAAAAAAVCSPKSKDHRGGTQACGGSSSCGSGAASHLRALAAGVASGGVAQMHGWCGTRWVTSNLVTAVPWLCFEKYANAPPACPPHLPFQ